MKIKNILKQLPKYKQNRKRMEMPSGVRTVQVGNRLIIMDGKSPLRYVDLDTNIVHQYKKVTKIKVKFYEEVKPTTTYQSDNADGIVNEGGKLYLVYIR